MRKIGTQAMMTGGALAALLSACVPSEPQKTEEPQPFSPEYLGVKTQLLDGDLVNFHVTMTGARGNEDVAAYAECAAAQYALIRGYGFARHVRTTVNDRGNTWTGNAAYVISAALPKGLKTIDAEVTVQNCLENGIPTV
ncbi:hypothetical protein XMM379_001369 [Aliiroseovarius sp. xm-m-379]|uniref:hypothetical protein n=1 Tax=unclassified Aliiroseovarius TaxID=2623558 RepID=UPI0019E63440|nr:MULTISPECIES: hypothetical protein [unclassified Aliiroseovarius]NRP12306.1 hypothetical protein [Aliiroseovarius sp. xm-d-517]NRP24680.1 hypothetical protein [Aliiroseovarius sp. xm-m-379]NRP30686.1 hypothetical protein [Aliiroseovarius sp. xm-m-314]NRP33479.1 hypothetical protein [Aliiroseovarius sp. xm-a-104]NRP40586.1 hypothetical protein [Aliiroseovarius sp. xm-m-339-2]